MNIRPVLITLSVTFMFCFISVACAQNDRPAFGVVFDGMPIHEARLVTAKQGTPIPIALAVFFLQWPERPHESIFPASSLRAIRAAGMVPCLTWEPMYIDAHGKEQHIPARRILDGDYDEYIRSFAKGFREYGGTVLLRFAHEPNLPRYHWGTSAKDFGPQSPALYRAMFRKVANDLRKLGCDNVRMVFCINAESLPREAWNTAEAWFPGTDVVSMLGIDGYNWGDSMTVARNGWKSDFRSFKDIFGPMRRELKKLAPGIPQLVFETSSAATGGDKAKWIEEAARTAREWDLAALCWFDVNKEVDWRLKTGLPPRALAKLRTLFAPDKQGLTRIMGAGK